MEDEVDLSDVCIGNSDERRRGTYLLTAETRLDLEKARFSLSQLSLGSSFGRSEARAGDTAVNTTMNRINESSV